MTEYNYGLHATFLAAELAAGKLQDPGLPEQRHDEYREFCINLLARSFSVPSGLSSEDDREYGLQQLRTAAEAGIPREDYIGYEASLGEIPQGSLIVLRPIVMGSGDATIVTATPFEVKAALETRFDKATGRFKWQPESDNPSEETAPAINHKTTEEQ